LNVVFCNDGDRLVASCEKRTVIWSVGTKAVEAVYEGCGDNMAVADSGKKHPYRALADQLVTQIEEKAHDRFVGVFSWRVLFGESRWHDMGWRGWKSCVHIPTASGNECHGKIACGDIPA
jgi:hypothetical protein